MKMQTIQNLNRLLDKKLDKSDSCFHQTKNESHHSYLNKSLDFASEYSKKLDQYYGVYIKRLKETIDNLKATALKKWPTCKITRQTIQQAKGLETQIVFGIIYKEMKLKPNILKGIESILEAKLTFNFVSDDSSDQLFLEDSSGRIRLMISNDFIDSSVSGTPMACM